MIVDLDVSDPETAARVVEIQRVAYAIEAELMGFWGIPPLTETAADVAVLGHLVWKGVRGEGLLVGLIAWESTSDVVDIDRLAVDPRHSRQGHGRQLVQAVPRDRPTIVSTGRANTPARALYLAEGFVQVGDTEVAPGVWTTQFRRNANP